jgi:cell division protease FtsH
MEKDKKEKGCKDGSEDCGPKHQDPLFKLPNKGQFKFSIWYFVAAVFILMIVNSLLRQPSDTTISYSEFKTRIESNEIRKVEITEKYYIGIVDSQLVEPGTAAPSYRAVPVDDPTFIPLLDQKGIEYFRATERNNYLLNTLINWLLPFLVLIFIWRFVFQRMGNMGSNVMSFGKNKAIIVAEGDTGVTFEDVAGEDEAKHELVEVVDFLQKPEKYTEIGGKIPKGVLLVGAPGTGKTLLAKAVAGEAEVPFFRMSGSDFVEMFVGVGAARVRDLFKQAREKAPCIIFIDELDAIGKSRVNMVGGNDEREQTLNQLLVEMDGFDSTTGVIILAATNRPEILDPALLRPGRFDRQVLVDRPDLQGREEILKIHSKNVKLDKKVNLNSIARSTPGFVGADLANLVNEAAILAVRGGRKLVKQQDLEEAIEKLVAGLEKKSRLINPKEREIVAYHETGHALVAAFTPGADPVQKISIVPRGLGALGYTLQMPIEDRFLMTENELLGKIDILLGGRAAEEIIFAEVSTGAANDLTKVSDIAKKMISEYGMSEKFKNVALSMRKPSMLGSQAEMPQAIRDYSESTQSYIDDEVARMVETRYRQVLSTLREKIDLLKTIANPTSPKTL